ncbi:MAG TPA: hypothetical protein ENH28_04720 [Euryarchaeota archaeon]|nr:hypothetical protein [Euryarchaeota archaeon]
MINIDCWNFGGKNRVLTHSHEDHIPCRPMKLSILPDTNTDFYHLYEELQGAGYTFKSDLKIKEVCKVEHLAGYVRVLLIEENCVSAIVIGDYDPPSWREIVKTVGNKEPDILFIPVYAKLVSNQKGRLLKTSKDLYFIQKKMVKEIQRKMRGLKQPYIVGMAHSKRAVTFQGLDEFIPYNQRIPSLLEYNKCLILCGEYSICKGCPRKRKK